MDQTLAVPSFVILVIGVAIGAAVLIVHWDKQRAIRYLAERGDVVDSIQWRIFGKGWMSEANKQGGGNRIYDIHYRDRFGNLKRVWCKTAMWSGVFLTDDRIVTPAALEGRPLTAEEKVALLEDEVQRLRAEQGQLERT